LEAEADATASRSLGGEQLHLLHDVETHHLASIAHVAAGVSWWP
jgi:hypothetical protein